MRDKRSENQSWVQNHSAEEIQAEDQNEALLINVERQRTNFPAPAVEKQWEDLDSKIVQNLSLIVGNTTLEQNLSLLVKSSTKLVSTPLETSQRSTRSSRRQLKMDNLRKQKRNLKKQMKQLV
ncbi:reverse transcriptase [Elysia marginata]|uniref:Reverse transcriptase n=1 Tax=Elysia marginata TaxID=1093978 RepID=A0AAV4FPS9_9GAST|nr:reverse transcriptase [Elysia marginata]